MSSSRHRVLLVDDSAVVRHMLTDALSADPSFEVVGTAPNGRLAIDRISSLRPDIVVLDIEMPEMDGITALTEIRRLWPVLPVIMFSSLTARGAAATIEALLHGANDYVAKPTGTSGPAASIAFLRETLIPRIAALCRPPAPASPSPTRHPPAPRLPTARAPAPPPVRALDPAIVAIGCSTGGPTALSVILGSFKRPLAVPVIVTQHMPPMFTRFLAERLSGRSCMPVREASNGQILEAGTVWVAPGDYHLCLSQSGTKAILRTTQTPPENSCRPSVDVMFRSVASVFRGSTLGIVLTGMGQDGLLGSQKIHELGGQILAQDEPTSVVWGMPGFVVRAGLADRVLPLDRIGPEIASRAHYQRALPSELNTSTTNQEQTPWSKSDPPISVS